MYVKWDLNIINNVFENVGESNIMFAIPFAKLLNEGKYKVVVRNSKRQLSTNHRQGRKHSNHFSN